jgi:hypothetical protein
MAMGPACAELDALIFKMAEHPQAAAFVSSSSNARNKFHRENGKLSVGNRPRPGLAEEGEYTAGKNSGRVSGASAGRRQTALLAMAKNATRRITVLMDEP